MAYGTLSGADEYHEARGNTAWTSHSSTTEKEEAMERGSDYVDGRYQVQYPTGRWASMFPGRKTGGRAQVRQWPRIGATDYEGNEIPDYEVPIEVEYASYEADLLELITPGYLSPVYVSAEQVIKEKVDVIETQYSDTGVAGMYPNRPIVPLIDEIIAPVLYRPALYPGVVAAVAVGALTF